MMMNKNNPFGSRAPLTDDELEQWARFRADDAGHLARELVTCRRNAASATPDLGLQHSDDVAVDRFASAMGAVWNNPATAPKDGTVLHLLVRPGQEPLDPLTSFQDSREPYETIGFNQLKDTLEDVWQFAGWDWCHDCITDGDGEVIGWRPFSVNAALTTSAEAPV